MSWLWKGDTSSPASFEKALSKLSTQITAASLSLESTRTRARRFTALWTLYTTLSYLLYTLVITLVLGPHKWSWPHYAGLVGAPAVIYLVRRGVTMFFDWRMARQQRHLGSLQKQRESKITDLKKATKYDSTQELLQKYGGAPKQTQSKQPQQGTKRKINPAPQPGRTGIAPPPTANLPGRHGPMSPSTPQGPLSLSSPKSSSTPQSPLISAGALAQSPTMMSPDEPGFAPNAFTSSVTPSVAGFDHPVHWYDRILDVLLGEDETLAKNRLALICSNCRLVNGQAPPGVKSLEEVGRWRCASCGAWNGVESVAANVMKEITEKKVAEEGWEKTSRETARDGEIEAAVADSGEEGSETIMVSTETADSDDGVEDGARGSGRAEETGGSTVSKRKTRSASKQLQEG